MREKEEEEENEMEMCISSFSASSFENSQGKKPIYYR